MKRYYKGMPIAILSGDIIVRKKNPKAAKSRLSVQIAGGIGNQLFMLYGGLYISEYLEKSIKYNLLDSRKISKLHPGFNIQSLGLVRNVEVHNDFVSCFQKVLWKAKKIECINFTKSRLLKKTFVAEEIGYVNPVFIPVETQFLSGYFQSWRYFELLTEKPVLNQSCLPSPSDWFQNMKNDIETQEPSVIHVRRGDYRLAENRKIGLLSARYYRQAITLLDPSKPVWVFSDSPELVESELQDVGRKLVFVNPPKESDPVESLLLMSMARAIVISNSTYSWWAAYLSRANTRILAPSKWYENQQDPADLFPHNWERIESRWQ
jgi:hypothetical protein